MWSRRQAIRNSVIESSAAMSALLLANIHVTSTFVVFRQWQRRLYPVFANFSLPESYPSLYTLAHMTSAIQASLDAIEIQFRAPLRQCAISCIDTTRKVPTAMHNVCVAVLLLQGYCIKRSSAAGFLTAFSLPSSVTTMNYTRDRNHSQSL